MLLRKLLNFYSGIENSTIYNGITPSLLRHKSISSYVPFDISNNEREHNSSSIKRFIIIGNIKKHKNISLAVSAFRILPGNYHLDIIGSVLNNGILNNLPSNVSYLGQVSDDELFYSLHKYKALIFPSLHEGFGLPVLEALCCSLPVIALKLPVFVELLEITFIILKTVSSLQSACMSDLTPPSTSDVYKLVKKYSWDNSGYQLASLLSQSCL